MAKQYLLTNAKEILLDAKLNKYAVPHININNLEWAKNILITANELKSPVILGASMGAIKYMGGYSTVANLVKSLFMIKNWCTCCAPFRSWRFWLLL